MKKLALQTISIVLFLSSPLSATIIRVPQDQSTIQAGINAAGSGDTVLVAPGTYTENIINSGKNIKIMSSSGPESTIITRIVIGKPVVKILNTNSYASLEGFTVENGIGDGLAGGVYLSNSSALIKNNIIRKNTGINDLASGLFCWQGGAPVVTDNIFKGNSGGDRTIEFVNVNPTLTRNLIVENANAVSIFVDGQIIAFNNTIARNSARWGFTLSDGPTGQISNNIITDNTELAIIVDPSGSIIITYNDFYNNTNGTIYGGTLGVGNIQANPRFVGGQPFSYELENNSPCIDSADPTTPIPLYGGARADIGAFEYTGFNLVSPANQEKAALRKPQFIWTQVHDTSVSATYRLLLDTTNNFASPDSSPPLADTTWKFSQLLKLNQVYYWKVIAIRPSGDTVFSRVKSFAVFPTFLLKLPLNNSRILIRQPTFVWQAVRDTSIPDIFTYQLLFSQNSDFSGAVASPILSDTTWQPPLPLEIGLTYFWKVLAFYGSITDTLRPSQDFRFILEPTKLVVPIDRPTIQKAIDISLNGDTVLVKPGTYVQNILFKGKKIKLLSEGGPESTTIEKLVDGAPLVSFFTSEDSNTVLRGFTLKGARLTSNGAAIYVGNASPVIENNYFQDNQGHNAVIYVQGGSPKIRRNLIADNNTNLTAIGFFGGAGGQIINNTIANNTGDGIRITSTMMMQIRNNILAFNTGYGIRSIDGVNSSSNVSYNDIFSNAQGTYFAAIPTTDDIYQNPLFRSGSPFDYHLLLGSPCIDSGDPGSPVPPGGGSRIDIGAFEFIPSIGDLNGDGMLNLTDVVLELDCVFLASGDCSQADVNCDGKLTSTDAVLELNAFFLSVPMPC